MNCEEIAPMTLCDNEDDCAVCSHWPARDREAMRDLIDTLPLREPVCDACLMAWWMGLTGEPAEPAEDEPPHH